MINAEALEKMSDENLATIIRAHERDMQMYRNSRRAGIFITRQISGGVADIAIAILRRRREDDKLAKIS